MHTDKNTDCTRVPGAGTAGTAKLCHRSVRVGKHVLSRLLKTSSEAGKACTGAPLVASELRIGRVDSASSCKPRS